MLENQIDQHERRETLRNDLRVKQQEQAGTFMSHTHSEMGGRFSGVGAQTIVGAEPIPNYPAAAPHQHDPCGPEKPLGYAIDAMPELGPDTSLGSGQGGADAPLAVSPDVEPAPPLSQNDDPAGTNPGHFPPRPARRLRGPGRHPFRRRV